MSAQLPLFHAKHSGGLAKGRRCLCRNVALGLRRLCEASTGYETPSPVLPHSEQPASRVLSAGVTACSSAELLAALLGQKDTVLGESLLARFDGLLTLARANAWELANLQGIGPALAARLQAAFELGRRVCAASPTERVPIRSSTDAASLFLPEMGLLEQEEMRVLLLDIRNRVIGVSQVYRGSLNMTMVRIGELFKEAVRRNAAGILAAHNHPSGDPSPSPEDVAMTRMMVEAGRLLSIEVIDHLVIGQQRWVSLKERNLGFG